MLSFLLHVLLITFCTVPFLLLEFLTWCVSCSQQHINELTMKMSVEDILCRAEAIYRQLAATPVRISSNTSPNAIHLFGGRLDSPCLQTPGKPSTHTALGKK